jgi:hypothetical protein
MTSREFNALLSVHDCKAERQTFERLTVTGPSGESRVVRLALESGGFRLTQAGPVVEGGVVDGTRFRFVAEREV